MTVQPLAPTLEPSRRSHPCGLGALVALIEGVEPGADLRPIGEISPPDLDLSDLDDLRGTLEMLREVGALP